MRSDSTKRSRSNRGSSIVEFAASLTMFFCFFLVPIIDIAFVPARYMLVETSLDKVVHRMVLSEKRSQAMKFLNSGSWKQSVERWGVKVTDAKANLIVCDDTGNSKMVLENGKDVPANLLPNGTHLPNGEVVTPLYAMELVAKVDVPPLFSSKIGLPGFSQPISFTFRHRGQWENVSPDPLTTSSPTAVKYYINE